MENQSNLYYQDDNKNDQNLKDYIDFCDRNPGNENDDEINGLAEINRNGGNGVFGNTIEICCNDTKTLDTKTLIGRKRNSSRSTVSHKDKGCSGSEEEDFSFDSLFGMYTVECGSDGNCFIWSALNLLDRDLNFENMLHLRSELQRTFDDMLNDQEYKEKYGAYVIAGYKGLEKNKEYVEINPGTVSLAKYAKSEVIAFSKTSGRDKSKQTKTEFSFVMANEKGELLFDCNLEQVKSKVIEGKIKTVVLNEKHYRPLKCDRASRINFLKGFFSLFIDQRYSIVKNSIKETVESKEESLLDNIRILLPDNNDTDMIYAKVIDIKTNIKDPNEKEKKLYDILDRVYKKSKELYTDQGKVLEEPASANENKKIDKFAKKLCDQGGSSKIEVVESNTDSCNKKNSDVNLNLVLDDPDDPSISPENKEVILNLVFAEDEAKGKVEKKPKLDGYGYIQEQIFGGC